MTIQKRLLLALALHRSASLALINDLPFDETAEREMIAAFALALEPWLL